MIRFFVLLLLCNASIAIAQSSASSDELNRLQNDINKLISEPATQGQALQQIDKLWSLDRQRTLSGLRNSWLRSLVASKRHDDVERWSRLSVAAAAQDLGAIEMLQTMRVRALLALGQNEKALAAAKSLYNVCSLSATAGTMMLLAECLNATNPATKPSTQSATQPLSLVDQFRYEQTAGATFDGKRPLTEKGKRSTVLDGIRIDAAEYDEEIRKLTAEDYQTLHARANLMLMADRASDAMSVFERAYALASDGQMQQASEAIARCMRAQDGTIGRANAWVNSIRPPKK